MSKGNSLISQLPAMQEALASGKKIEFETHGYSMVPLLHDGGDKVILVKTKKPLKVNDVAFCRTSEGRYVLHRVVALKNNGYILKGDNCINTEYCVSDDDVIGVACAFVRKGVKISVTNKIYLHYVHHRSFYLKLWRIYWRASDFVVRLLRKGNRGA